MDARMKDSFEKDLIEHCAPTLASLKTANLFCHTFSSEAEMQEIVGFWRECLNRKGLTLVLLRIRRLTALVYVCRMENLRSDLSRDGVVCFLSAYGYDGMEPSFAVERLKERIESEADFGFPHEIGLFLGYPLADVVGFIENEGRNFKFAGLWKVYCNEYETLRLFAKFEKCKNVYRRLWREGRSVLQLTVAV